jgi:pyruvate,water dikinase
LRGLPVLQKVGKVYDELAKENQAFKDSFPAEEREFLDVDLAQISDDELAHWIRRVLAFHLRANYFGMTTSYVGVQAQDDFRPMLAKLNKALPPGEEPIAMANLMTAPDVIATAQPVLEMWKLARDALANPHVTEMIRAASVSDLSARLQESREGRAFWQKVEAYIARFFYMSPIDEDFALPRYDEDPTIPLTILKQFVTSGQVEDPAAHLAAQRALLETEQARARQYLERGLYSRLFDRSAFLKQMAIVQRYAYWREEMRELVGRAHYLCHRFFGELGRRWAACGFIAEAGDVFLLRREQILAALDGQFAASEAQGAIAKFKRLRAAYHNFEAPWTIGVETRRHAASPGVIQKTFQGVACGAGRVCAPARVVKDISEAGRLQKGEILIAPYTNPGWTPLFSLAAGIVMEEGGLLSHGAVIARECNIPAVLQIKNATRLFHDGQTLRVDGTRGVVQILNGDNA